jgi:hypothetical protein
MSDSLRPVNMGGVVVLSVMGAIWALVGLVFAGAPVVVWVLPATMALDGIIAGAQLSRHHPPMAAAEKKRIGRLVGLWSGAEGIAIFFANMALIARHREDLIVAAICTIVGLHFFALARGIPQPVYWLTALAMTLLGAGGLLVSSVFGAAVVGFGAAMILWITLLGILVPAWVALRAAG